MRTVVAWSLFPSLLVGAIALTGALLRAGVQPGLAAFAVIALSAVPVLLAEGWMPARQAWRRRLVTTGVDVVHMASTGLAAELFRAAAFGAMLWAASALSAALGATVWPVDWPLGAQLALALVLGDLGPYLVHRLAHAGPLWSIHAMHHSSDRLTALSAGRNHPLNAVAAYATAVAPLVLLGAGDAALTALGVFTAVHGMLQHCNADLRHGALSYVFATADVHRLHHSTRRDEADANFGSNLMIWDHLFGTFSLPHRRGPDAVGLDGVALPENVWVHLASPFALRRWLRPAERP